jgi:hypothetical protein
MNADLSKKLLKFCAESALIVHRRFKGTKSKLVKVQLVIAEAIRWLEKITVNLSQALKTIYILGEYQS